MHFDRHLVSHRPMDRPALFQMNHRSRRKAEPVKNLAAEKLALLYRGQDPAGFGIYRLVSNHHLHASGGKIRRRGKDADLGVEFLTRNYSRNEIRMADKV